MRVSWLNVCALIGIAVCSVGAADARAQDDLIEMVVELLADPDKEMRSLALEQVRGEAPGSAATERFAAMLTKLPADSTVALLSALADRGDAAAAPEVRKLLKSTDDASIRVAAVQAVGKLGDASDVAALLQHWSAGATEEKSAARRSLVVLAGDKVEQTLIASLDEATTPVRVMLMEVLTERRARTAPPALLKLAVDDDPAVRRAAMAALGRLARPRHIESMVQGVLRAERGRERDAAEKAVMFVCQRIEEPDERALPLLAAIEQTNKEDRRLLLPGLGRVGGKPAIKAIEQALRSDDKAMQEAGLRGLCNWPNASVAPRLIELAKTEASAGRRRMATRALIRVAPLPDDRTNLERLQLLKTAMELCERDADRLAVLERAKAVRAVETLRYLLTFFDQPEFVEQACLTVVELAHHSGLRESNREEFHAALDRVIATSQDAVVVDRAQRYKAGKTWVRPK